MTQENLAALIGTKQPAIARLESGAWKNVSIKTLQKIAEAFDCGLSVRFDSFAALFNCLARTGPSSKPPMTYEEEREISDHDDTTA